jgi:tyrosyl-tRNA synthetase
MSSSEIQSQAKEQLQVFKEGLVDLISEKELLKKLEKSIETKTPLRIKYGVDPSASDIHLGHTVPLFKLRRLQDLGHIVIFLIGDFTARVGDPSGQSNTRTMLTKKETDQNAKTYQDQVFKILDKKKTEVVKNSKWFDKMGAEDFCKLTTHATVHQIIERDDFKKRFEGKQPISVLEFLYPLLQGYDSVELKSDVEVGGTDQKFNLLMGRELQRDYSQEPQVVMTLPIIEGTDGVQKMSKSLGNAIEIDLPPNDMFGKIMSLRDDKMWSYFELCTDANSDELEAVKKRVISDPRNLKADLAKKIITFFHNEKEANQASDAFDSQFRDKQNPDEIAETILKGDYPEQRGTILQISAEAGDELGLSGSEIRRLIKQGAVKVNGTPVEDPAQDFSLDSDLVVQYGKRKFRKYHLA